MKNEYSIVGKTCNIKVTYKGQEFICRIDADKLDKVSQASSWNVDYKKNSDKFYVRGVLNGKLVQIHRIIMDAKPGEIVDHIDGDTFNNVVYNLRITNKSGNAQNSGIRKDNKSGVRGVWRDKTRNKWIAEIRVNNHKMFLGRYEELEDAEKAVLKAKEVHHPLSQRTKSE